LDSILFDILGEKVQTLLLCFVEQEAGFFKTDDLFGYR